MGATFFLRDMACTSCGGRLSVMEPPPVVPLLGGLYEICTGLDVEAADAVDEEAVRLIPAPAAVRVDWTEALTSDSMSTA